MAASPTKNIQRTTDSLRDHFLIATPSIDRGFFKGSVAYICEHGEAGAMGVVINKPWTFTLPIFLSISRYSLC